MTEEFNVFGDLDALCDENLLAKFKSSVPSLKSSEIDDDIDDDIRGMENGKKMRTRKNDNVSLEDELLSPILPATPKLNSPLKRDRQTRQKCPQAQSRSPKKRSERPVEDSLSIVAATNEPSFSKAPSAIEPPLPKPVTSKRQTRSMSKNKPDTPTTQATVSAKTTSAKATTSTVASISRATAGRRSVGRGRKKRKQNQTLPGRVFDWCDLSEMDAPALNPIQALWNRRNIAAERAARCTNVDYIDLVSSPVPQISGVVNVDSDTDDCSNSASSTPVAKTSSLDLSFDEENPEISVKVIWNGKPEIFKLRRHQKFAHIFNIIALREKTEETSLAFNLNNKFLKAEDTPASIDYKIFQCISGRVLVSKFTSPVGSIRKKRDANKILLKIQSDKWKKPLQIELLRTDKFKVLYIKCAEELNIPYENFTLSFDGDLLKFEDTPAALELEGGEAIDLRIRN